MIMADEKRASDVKRLKRRCSDDSILDRYFQSTETEGSSNELQKKCLICSDVVLPQQQQQKPDELKNYLSNNVRQKHPEVFDDPDDYCGPPSLRRRMTPPASAVDVAVANAIADSNPDESSSDDETDGLFDGGVINNDSKVSVDQETLKFSKLLQLLFDSPQLNEGDLGPSPIAYDVIDSSDGFDEPDAGCFSADAARGSSRECADYCRTGSQRRHDYRSVHPAISSMASEMSCDICDDTVDGLKSQENAALQGDDDVDSGLNVQSDQCIDRQTAGTSSQTGLSEEEVREMGAILRNVADKFHVEHLQNGQSPSVSELLKGVASYEVFDSVVSSVIRDDTIVRQIALLYRLAGDAIKSKTVDVGNIYSWTTRYFQNRFAQRVAQSSGLENVVRNSPESNATSV